MKKMIATFLILFTAGICYNIAQKQPYLPGEKVSYQIRYGIIGSGIATLELKEGFFEGEKIWHATMTGRTTGITDALYRVRDTYESYIDPQNDLPLFAIRNIQEGRYQKYNEVWFDHTTRTDSALLFSDLSGNHTAPGGVLDILSCFYWFRKYYLAEKGEPIPGQTYTMITWFADELYPITLRYKGKEMVKNKNGKILCYRFHPVTEVGRVFKTEEDMTMWFTADENFLPIKIRFDIFVGAFHVEMTSYEGLATPLKFIN